MSIQHNKICLIVFQDVIDVLFILVISATLLNQSGEWTGHVMMTPAHPQTSGCLTTILATPIPPPLRVPPVVSIDL